MTAEHIDYPTRYRPAHLCPGNPYWYKPPRDISRPKSVKGRKITSVALWFLYKPDHSEGMIATVRELSVHFDICTKFLRTYLYRKTLYGYTAVKMPSKSDERLEEGLTYVDVPDTLNLIEEEIEMLKLIPKGDKEE